MRTQPGDLADDGDAWAALDTLYRNRALDGLSMLRRRARSRSRWSARNCCAPRAGAAGWLPDSPGSAEKPPPRPRTDDRAGRCPLGDLLVVRS
jgi:hypothetical protein